MAGEHLRDADGDPPFLRLGDERLDVPLDQVTKQAAVFVECQLIEVRRPFQVHRRDGHARAVPVSATTMPDRSMTQLRPSGEPV